MKVLEIEVDEYTILEENYHCHSITVKVKQTDENSEIISKQLKKQIDVYEGKDRFNGKFVIGSDEWLLESSLNYKFVIDSDEWLFEGCWLPNVYYFSYKEDSYLELTVRFDNATKKINE